MPLTIVEFTSDGKYGVKDPAHSGYMLNRAGTDSWSADSNVRKECMFTAIELVNALDSNKFKKYLDNNRPVVFEKITEGELRVRAEKERENLPPKVGFFKRLFKK